MLKCDLKKNVCADHQKLAMAKVWIEFPWFAVGPGEPQGPERKHWPTLTTQIQICVPQN